MKTRITIRLSKEKDRYAVLFGDFLSHDISVSRLEALSREAEGDFWKIDSVRQRELGEGLFSVLDGSGGRLRSELDRARGIGERLDLYLVLPEVLDGIPFELMYERGFLALERDVNIFRLVVERGERKAPVPKTGGLKALFMACSPRGPRVLDFEAEEELILSETEKLHLHMAVEDSGSLAGLAEMVIGEGGFDMVHLSGHADVDDQKGPFFCMEDEIGGLDKVAPERLNEALKSFFPRVLFLSGCSTCMHGPAEADRSFAARMVTFGVGFVMGWARPVTDMGAVRLAAHLFRYLAMGKTIAESVTMARKETLDRDGTWALFRVYSDASPPEAIIASGQGVRVETFRKTVHGMLGKSDIRVLEKGFVGRRRQIQAGVRVLRGGEPQKGLLITGAAGVGKSCLAGKLMERFPKKNPVAVRGKLDPAILLDKLKGLFERYDIRSGLEIILSDAPVEDRLAGLFRNALREHDVILYLDDFEDNLQPVPMSGAGAGAGTGAGGPWEDEDVHAIDPEVLPMVRGLLRGLPWASGRSNLIISSRYPFRLVHGGEDLVRASLSNLSLGSMRDAELKKKIGKLEFISKSEHRDLYIDAGKGNPRLLEWLDKIAADEGRYDLTDIRRKISGRSADYIAEYLFDIMARAYGEPFESFLRRAAVFREPVPSAALAAFGPEKHLARASRLTLIEKETRPDNDLYRVHPMIRKAEFEKLSPEEKKSARESAFQWYETEVKKADPAPLALLTETVHHALAAGHVLRACGHAKDLGQVMKKMQLYRERVLMQQHAADHITPRVVERAIAEKNGAVAVLMSDLGAAYNMMGDYGNVIQWTREALELDLKILGENHPNVAIYNNNLGEAYRALGQSEKAIGYYERALAIDRKNFGENHPAVAREYNNLGSAYDAMGQSEKAIGYYERALAIDRKNFGENHPKVAIRYNNLGSAYHALGQSEKAIGYFERALAIDRKNFGENHPAVAREYNNLGSAYDAMGQSEKAIGYYERALAIDRKNFGENHPKVAIRYNNLGSAYDDLGQSEKAIGYFERALAIDRKNFGENHPDTAIDYNNLGSAYDALGQSEKAIGYYERALAIFIGFFGPDHPSSKTVRNNLESAKKARARG